MLSCSEGLLVGGGGGGGSWIGLGGVVGGTGESIGEHGVLGVVGSGVAELLNSTFSVMILLSLNKQTEVQTTHNKEQLPYNT